MTDLIWPRLTGSREPVMIHELRVDAMDTPMLAATEAAVTARWASVEDRFKIVEAKLTGLITQLSVLSAATIAGLAVALNTDALAKVPDFPFGVILTGSGYIAAQVVCSLLAVIRGLERRSFRQLSQDDLRPRAGESDTEYRARLLGARWQAIWWNDDAINDKVSYLAVAHVAIRNALMAVALLIGAAAVFAAWRRWV